MDFNSRILYIVRILILFGIVGHIHICRVKYNLPCKPYLRSDSGSRSSSAVLKSEYSLETILVSLLAEKKKKKLNKKHALY